MRRLLVLGLSALLAACGTVRWPAAAAPDYTWIKADAPRPQSRVEALLAYADYARALPAAEAGREQERLRQALSTQDRADFARLQYALLLAFSAHGRDLPRARQALEPVLREEGGDADLRRLAVFLNAGIGDALETERRYREEQRRAGDLDQKLEALKSIERRIIQRDKEQNR